MWQVVYQWKLCLRHLISIKNVAVGCKFGVHISHIIMSPPPISCSAVCLLHLKDKKIKVCVMSSVWQSVVSECFSHKYKGQSESNASCFSTLQSFCDGNNHNIKSRTVSVISYWMHLFCLTGGSSTFDSKMADTDMHLYQKAVIRLLVA